MPILHTIQFPTWLQCVTEMAWNIPTVNNIAATNDLILYTHLESIRISFANIFYKNHPCEWTRTSAAACRVFDSPILFNQAESFRIGEKRQSEKGSEKNRIQYLLFGTASPVCIWALKCMYQALNQNKSIHLSFHRISELRCAQQIQHWPILFFLIESCRVK